jgi:ribonuclease HI
LPPDIDESQRPEEAVFRETAQDLFDRLGIADWDLVLVGDGSGSNWGHEVGWACVAIQRTSFSRRVFHGGMNDGTVNVAEMMAYFAPLTWFMGLTAREAGVKHVHIITDSQYVRDMGTRRAPVTGGQANQLLWAAYQLAERQGYRIHWHWRNRDDVALNRFTDALSKANRLRFKGEDLRLSTIEGSGLDPEKLNPWE